MNTAVILAAGKGSRMKADINKQFLMLQGKPIIVHTLEAFNKCSEIHEIIVVTALEELEHFRSHILDRYDLGKVKSLIPGGAERQQSAYIGVSATSLESEIVLLHDGARPFVNEQIIVNCIGEAKLHGAVSVGMPSKDTIKLVDENNLVKTTPPRDKVWLTQTPQAFHRDLISKAHTRALELGITATDDAMLVELMGHPVKMVKGAYENIKITTPEDITIAEQLIKTINK